MEASQQKTLMTAAAAILGALIVYIPEPYQSIAVQIQAPLWMIAGVLLGGAHWRRPGDASPVHVDDAK